jgi:hypothetical protein
MIPFGSTTATALDRYLRLRAKHPRAGDAAQTDGWDVQLRATRLVRAKRQRGEIETLPSGSLRVKVYAGVDPVTRNRRYLTETIRRVPRPSVRPKGASAF